MEASDQPHTVAGLKQLQCEVVADERTLNKTEGWVGPRARLDV